MTHMQASDSALKICRNCKTPKEAIVEAFGRKFKVPVMCKCEEEKYNRQKEEAEKKRTNNEIRTVKKLLINRC